MQTGVDYYNQRAIFWKSAYTTAQSASTEQICTWASSADASITRNISIRALAMRLRTDPSANACLAKALIADTDRTDVFYFLGTDEYRGNAATVGLLTAMVNQNFVADDFVEAIQSLERILTPSLPLDLRMNAMLALQNSMAARLPDRVRNAATIAFARMVAGGVVTSEDVQKSQGVTQTQSPDTWNVWEVIWANLNEAIKNAAIKNTEEPIAPLPERPTAKQLINTVVPGAGLPRDPGQGMPTWKIVALVAGGAAIAVGAVVAYKFLAKPKSYRMERRYA